AKPAFDVVDTRPREAGVRGAEEGEELLAPPVGPRKAQERRERVTNGRRSEPASRLECIRDAEARERGLERRTEALGRRYDDPEAVGRESLPQERKHLLRD